jgi:predicted DNA binding CopG/RHH family protein
MSMEKTMDERLTERVTIRLSKSELKAVWKAADYYGVETGQWIRAVIRKALREK